MHSLTESVQLEKTCGVWSYHWGSATKNIKLPAGNFPEEFSIARNFQQKDMLLNGIITDTWNFSDKYGIIPVQNGKT